MVQITYAISERQNAEARRERSYIEWQTRMLLDMMVTIAPVEYHKARDDLFDMVGNNSRMIMSDEVDLLASLPPKEEVEGVDYRMVRGQRYPIRVNDEAKLRNFLPGLVTKR